MRGCGGAKPRGPGGVAVRPAAGAAVAPGMTHRCRRAGLISSPQLQAGAGCRGRFPQDQHPPCPSGSDGPGPFWLRIVSAGPGLAVRRARHGSSSPANRSGRPTLIGFGTNPSGRPVAVPPSQATRATVHLHVAADHCRSDRLASAAVSPGRAPGRGPAVPATIGEPGYGITPSTGTPTLWAARARRARTSGLAGRTM